MTKYTIEESVDKITHEPCYNLSDNDGNTVFGLNYSQALTIARWLVATEKSDSQKSEKIFSKSDSQKLKGIGRKSDSQKSEKIFTFCIIIIEFVIIIGLMI